MKVIITKASDDRYSTIKNFNTLEDLLEFIKKVKCELIISQNFRPYVCRELGDDFSSEEKECPLEVMIYDDYVE